MQAINDNLNTPLALGVLFSMLKNEQKSADIYKLSLDFDKVFGLKLDEVKAKQVDVPSEVQALAQARWEAKLNKNWAEADKLRNKVSALGYEIKDGKDGFEIVKR